MSAGGSFLNEVDITSKIRAPGEYKYYYCGENNTETDKSFLVFSSMWYTEKITEDMELQASCYNMTHTAQIFLNTKTNIYNLLIYQNIFDYHNENMILKLIKKVNISSKFKIENLNNRNELDKNIVKIYFASNNYILVNEIDYRIILLDSETGNFITIFTAEEKEPLYNIIDTYDELYMTDGQQRIRTYVFLSKKNQERKTPTYSYKYFIIQRNVFQMKTFFLHNIDFDLGNSEPIGLKIGKIVKPDCNEQKFMYIFIFMSSSTILQLITDYDNVTLHQMLKKHSRTNNTSRDNDDDNLNESNEENSNRLKNSLENLNPINDDGILKTKHWIIKRNVESEKKQFSQSIKIALNINNKRVCAFILFFEAKRIISYIFNYSDSPEEIKEKIFINSNINLRLDDRSFEQTFKKPAKIYKFIDCYLFRSKCFFGYSNNNLIISDKNRIHIYCGDEPYPIYTYEFYNETLSSFFYFEGLGSTFLLTGTKLFKIIYNIRYNLFSNENIFKNDKIYIHDYKIEKKLSFPAFEFKPEDIWNSYCICLGIEPIIDLNRMNSRKNVESVENADDIMLNEEEEDYEEEYFNFNKKNLNFSIKDFVNSSLDKTCALCGKESEKCCCDCNMRFYCCNEHFQYDYYSYHFFECQLIQFFKRKDIMLIIDKEIRYKVLYNELIKVAARILTFIFKRIYSKKDYQYFLKMILTLIQIMDNFGFAYNLSEFCTSNYTPNEKKYKHEKIIFYQEALYFYVHLNMLKCTFASKSGLYNLTDCYLKIIKNDIIPLLTPKVSKRLISLKSVKPKLDIIYNNDYFNEFDSELFFDITKYVRNIAASNVIDLVEEYIIKHLMTLSLLIKFKKKINSSIDIQNSFVDINLMFDDHYNESGYKNIVSYCYFFTSFYLIEIGKVPQTVKLYKRMVSYFFNLENDNIKLKAFTYYNLGLLQYALGYFDIGVHNIEIAYKLIVENNFSDKIKFKVIDTLGLAYLNRRNLFKAYLLIQKSIQERKKLDKKNNEIICTKLNVYLNYIIDLYEYTFISKARLLIKKKYKNIDKRQLLNFVLGEDDKELVISEQNPNQFIKVVEFIWNLPDHVLKQLNSDNPPKTPSIIREEHQHDRNISFNSEVSVSMNMTSTFIYRENGPERDDVVEEYEEDIEVKTTLYDTLLSRKQQQDFKELKSMYLKRDIVLRDSLGDIEKFNINYEPIYAKEFQKIIEKLKSNFLLKEIFYCFQNEKWRDELYNYNQNNILFGLSKYLKLEKIQNMMAIEKTKIMEMIKQEKLKRKNYLNCNLEGNEKIDKIKEDFNSTKINDLGNDRILEEDENEIEIPYDRMNSNSSIILSENEKDKKNNIEKADTLDYQKFKEKFVTQLKELEKDKKNEDLYEFLNFDEDYLYNLYINVYKNNPNKEMIFKNPLLILNYIFIEINKTTDKENKKNIIDEALNISKIKEEKKSFQSSESKNEDDSKEREKNLSKSSSINDSSKSKSSISEDSESKNKSKEKEQNDENNNSNEENAEINRMNTLTKKFILSQLLYDYNLDEIDETKEITLTFICEKKPVSERIPTSRKNTTKRNRDREKEKEKDNTEFSRGFIISLYPDNRDSKDIEKEKHRTFIEEADKLFFMSKDLIDEQKAEKTFAIIQKKNRLRNKDKVIDLDLNLDKTDNIGESKTNNLNNKKSFGFSFSPDDASKKKITIIKKETEMKKKTNNDNFNYLKNRGINYLPFINKSNRDSKIPKNNKNKKKNIKSKKENDKYYFDLAKEINKYEQEQQTIKNRGKSLDVNNIKKETIKNKNNKNNKNNKSIKSNKNNKSIKNNKKRDININIEKEKEEFDSFYNNPMTKNQKKNTTLPFKTKVEMEKEIEDKAIKYLNMNYGSKEKNNIRNRRVFQSSGIDDISLRKKIYNKSVDNNAKKNKYFFDNNIEKNKYLNKINANNKNYRKNNKKTKRFNSSSTKNTSFSKYNIKKNVMSDSSLKSLNSKNDIFQKEWKKIIDYNKKNKNESNSNYNKNNKSNYRLKTEEYKFDDIRDENEPIYTEYQQTFFYHRNIRSMPKQYICNFKRCPENKDKSGMRHNARKYNVISTTNYTNTETPKNTTKNTFHGIHKNNNSRL